MNIKLEVTKYNLTSEEETKIKYLLEKENKTVTPKNIRTLLLETLEYYLIKYPEMLEDTPNRSISNLFTFLIDHEYIATLGSEIYEEEAEVIKKEYV